MGSGDAGNRDLFKWKSHALVAVPGFQPPALGPGERLRARGASVGSWVVIQMAEQAAWASSCGREVSVGVEPGAVGWRGVGGVVGIRGDFAMTGLVKG